MVKKSDCANTSILLVGSTNSIWYPSPAGSVTSATFCASGDKSSSHPLKAEGLTGITIVKSLDVCSNSPEVADELVGVADQNCEMARCIWNPEPINHGARILHPVSEGK